MRTCVRDRAGRDPPRRPRRVLRLGRAARRPAAPRPPGDRRRRRRARGELRGEGVRRSDGDGWRAGAAPLPAGGRRPASVPRLQRGEQGGVRGLRRHDAARRGPLDRRGVPRRARAASGSPGRPSRSPPGCGATCSSAVGLPITVGVARTKFLAKVASGVAKPDGLLVVEPERRARLPPPAPRRAALGRRARDGRDGSTRAACRRSARSPPSMRTRSSRCSVARAGRHLHALAHNRDPRRVETGSAVARSARSARSAAPPLRRRRSTPR